MDCRMIEGQNVIERYLTEKLSSEEAEAFELHYLGCKRCFQELKMRHAAAIEMVRDPIPLKTSRHGLLAFRTRWAFATVVAVLFALIIVVFFRPVGNRPPQSSGQSVIPSSPTQTDATAVITQMAAVEQPPPYIPSPLRGGEGNPARERFEQGMRAYTAGDYKAAIGPLSQAAQLDRQNDPTAFYLGISYLLTESVNLAIEQLSKLTVNGNPYTEEAHWYLAKAYLKQNDTSSASAELKAVVSLNGRYAADAQEALRRLDALRIPK